MIANDGSKLFPQVFIGNDNTPPRVSCLARKQSSKLKWSNGRGDASEWWNKPIIWRGFWGE